MSKTFKEWLEIGGRQDHYGEYDMEESWDAAQKAMLYEVINIAHDCMDGFEFIPAETFKYKLKQKYGVKIVK